MIRVKNLTKTLPQREGLLTVLENISFTVKEGEFVTIFGPNGAGKSTLLYLIALLEKADSGEIIHDRPKGAKSTTGFVFQNYNESLLPWRTVLANITLPLEAQGVSFAEAHPRAMKVIDDMGLTEQARKYPYQLSGGQKQLVALARAFVVEPSLLLLDEPTSSLDFHTTQKIAETILRFWERKKATTLCVSHSIDEAILLSDRVIILSSGPGKIVAEIVINLPRPRTIDMVKSRQFFAYRQKILSIINESPNEK